MTGYVTHNWVVRRLYDIFSSPESEKQLKCRFSNTLFRVKGEGIGCGGNTYVWPDLYTLVESSKICKDLNPQIEIRHFFLSRPTYTIHLPKNIEKIPEIDRIYKEMENIQKNDDVTSRIRFEEYHPSEASRLAESFKKIFSEIGSKMEEFGSALEKYMKKELSEDSGVEVKSSLEINVDEGKINNNSGYQLKASVRNPKLPETQEGIALLQWLDNKVEIRDRKMRAEYEIISRPEVEVSIPGIYLRLDSRPADENIYVYFEVRKGRYTKNVIDFLERSIYGEV